VIDDAGKADAFPDCPPLDGQRLDRIAVAGQRRADVDQGQGLARQIAGLSNLRIVDNEGRL
jgi:hypothetical protein